MSAARRIVSAGEAKALQLALDYQLMSPRTNCVLVHQRADGDKATEEAELHRVGSMLVAGWGATSTVLASASFSLANLNTPSVWRSARSQGTPRRALPAMAFDDMDDDLAFSQTVDAVATTEPRRQRVRKQLASLEEMAAAVVEHLAQGGSLQGLATHCEALQLHADARQALYRAGELGFDADEAWLLLAHWVNRRAADSADPVVTTVLRPHLAGIDTDRIDACMRLFDHVLGGHASDGWGLSRQQRLQRALGRTA